VRNGVGRMRGAMSARWHGEQNRADDHGRRRSDECEHEQEIESLLNHDSLLKKWRRPQGSTQEVIHLQPREELIRARCCRISGRR
jgi:hypothetical protein